jgi:glycerol uptake facilitator-like aquaporin
MNEPSMVQKLATEAIGTAFLAFIGVGSIPATLIANERINPAITLRLAVTGKFPLA